MPKAGHEKGPKARFFAEHASTYGLKIMERCPSTSEVVSGLGMYSRHTLQTLDDELHRKVLHSIGHLTTRIVEGIINIQAERNERNNADSDLPHVLPHELIKISTGEFGKIVIDIHLQQLRHS